MEYFSYRANKSVRSLVSLRGEELEYAAMELRILDSIARDISRMIEEGKQEVKDE